MYFLQPLTIFFSFIMTSAMATYLFRGRPDPPPSPPLLRARNLLQSIAMDSDDNNKHQGGRIPLPFLDSLSHFNQELAVHAQDQEPQEKGTRSRRVPLILSCVLRTSSSHHWNIKKTLTNSDVSDHLCRLMLKKAVVHEHILGKWDVAHRNEILETERGSRVVNVLDINTDTEHQLVFKKWRSCGSFVFTNHWGSDFVKRRGLKEGDEVGFYWDTACSRFLFCVLSLA